MDDDLLDDIPVTEPKKAKKQKFLKTKTEPWAATSKPIDLEAAHKKFVGAMIGVFVIILVLMMLFHEYLEFSIDGGI